MSETAQYFDYSQEQYDIRQDLPEAYRDVWDRIASPGNWFRAGDRVSVAAEVRAARDCDLCQQRKSALSPFSVKGTHRSNTNLPDVAIDAVHRLATDASRLTESWLNDCRGKGLTIEQYVELLGIVVAVISIDAFHRAMGIALEVLPVPRPGEPDRYRPESAVDGAAWVPMIPAASAAGAESDLYDGRPQTGNVVSAMSLVPDSVRMLKSLSAVQYLAMSDVPNPTKNGNRNISRAQIELLAGRVSALNDCFY